MKTCYFSVPVVTRRPERQNLKNEEANHKHKEVSSLIYVQSFSLGTEKMREPNLSHSYEKTTPIIAIMAGLTASKSERAEELIFFFFFFSDVLFARLPVLTSHREITMEGRFPGKTETV